MDKYVALLCKQNPTMTLKCNNPDCDYKVKVNSADVFTDELYSIVCPDCGKTTTYDTSQFADNFKKQLQKLGVTTI